MDHFMNGYFDDILNIPIETCVTEIFDDILNTPIEGYMSEAKEPIGVSGRANFREEWAKLGGDNAKFKQLRRYLLDNPEAGDKIHGKRNGGLSGAWKLRWSFDKDKCTNNGNLRIVYAYIDREKILALLTIYDKNKRKDLTPADEKYLDKVIRDMEKGC